MARTREIAPIIFTLPNGLRCAFRHVPGVAECCGIAINAGSRDERPDEWGIAHFVEHTIFKGTARRRSHHILNRMESVGGELNAYTTKEETLVYTLAPAGNMARSMELLADLISRSVFPKTELDKERIVVIDEINSYLDSPADAAYDDFEDEIYKGAQLGHNILGTPRSVKKLTSEDCHDWVKRFFTAENMVLFYSGPGTETRFNALAQKHFIDIAASATRDVREPALPVAPFDISRSIHSHQTHTVMGTRCELPPVEKKLSFNLLNNILGGPGMNSILNIALRERRGLVYTVESSLAYYTDSMMWTCYFGCDKEYLNECKSLVNEQLNKLSDTPLTSSALARSKKQFLGQVILSGASVENCAISLGRSVLRNQKYLVPSLIETELEKITAEHLRETAHSLNAVPLSALTFY